MNTKIRAYKRIAFGIPNQEHFSAQNHRFLRMAPQYIREPISVTHNPKIAELADTVIVMQNSQISS